MESRGILSQFTSQGVRKELPASVLSGQRKGSFYKKEKELKSICNSQVLRIYAIIGNSSVNGTSYYAFFFSFRETVFFIWYHG